MDSVGVLLSSRKFLNHSCNGRLSLWGMGTGTAIVRCLHGNGQGPLCCWYACQMAEELDAKIGISDAAYPAPGISRPTIARVMPRL